MYDPPLSALVSVCECVSCVSAHSPHACLARWLLGSGPSPVLWGLWSESVSAVRVSIRELVIAAIVLVNVCEVSCEWSS